MFTKRGAGCDKGSFSSMLYDLSRSLPARGLTLRELLDCLRERGLLAMCMVMTVPFLLPMSIPGSSTPFGLAIALIGLGVVVDRAPSLPRRIMDRSIAAEHLFPLLQKGAWLFGKIERWTYPRLPALACGKTMVRINALVMVFSAVMLMFPLPLPLSNTLPAYGVLFLAAGNLERDGFLVILGYLMVFLAVIYFGLLTLLGTAGLRTLFG